jgi:hypothetical protein
MAIYKDFRNVNRTENLQDINLSRGTFSNYYDMPTYLSFKLQFSSPEHSNTAQAHINYDMIPQPLFSKYRPTDTRNQDSYSTLAYLESINEFGRAKMLEQFIDQFNSLQNDFSWYFQKVEGVADLLKIDPTKGVRVPDDRRLTITCLEGLDLRMSLLLSLYRKIAWDDKYQRWILPDIMRMFQLKIYIAEFRTFHHAIKKIDDPLAAALTSGKIGESDYVMTILDSIIPVWVITCYGCQFDLGEIEYDHISGLTVADVPPMGAVKFKIKIKSMNEAQIYPMFNHLVINDTAINGVDRGDETVDVLAESYNQMYSHDGTVKIAQNYPKASSDRLHESGRSFNQSVDITDIQGNKYFKPLDENNIPTAKPDTWVNRFANNTLDFAVSSAKSYVKQQIDKLRMFPIPEIGGLSFNEAVAGVQSADILTMYSLIKRSMNVAANEFSAPSSRLGNEISDQTFNLYLKSLSTSEVTNNENISILKATAEVLLNNPDIYSSFNQMVENKFSGITLTSIDDLFNGTTITTNSLKEYVEQVTGGDLSSATIDPGETPKQWAAKTIELVSNIPNNNIITGGEMIAEGTPTSVATNSKIIKS